MGRKESLAKQWHELAPHERVDSAPAWNRQELLAVADFAEHEMEPALQAVFGAEPTPMDPESAWEFEMDWGEPPEPLPEWEHPTIEQFDSAMFTVRLSLIMGRSIALEAPADENGCITVHHKWCNDEVMEMLTAVQRALDLDFGWTPPAAALMDFQLRQGYCVIHASPFNNHGIDRYDAVLNPAVLLQLHATRRMIEGHFENPGPRRIGDRWQRHNAELDRQTRWKFATEDLKKEADCGEASRRRKPDELLFWSDRGNGEGEFVTLRRDHVLHFEFTGEREPEEAVGPAAILKRIERFRAMAAAGEIRAPAQLAA